MRRDFFIGCVLIIIVAAVFSPALRGDFVQWDDDINIYKNPHIQKLSAENLGWMFTDSSYTPRYRPLNWLGWALLWQFSGGTAGLFHLVAVMLHAANAVLLFLLLKEILQRIWPDETDRALSRHSICAALAALIWAVNPLRAEAVGWINCQTYTQSLFFLLLSLWFYFRAVQKNSETQTTTSNRKSFWLSVVFFALAMLTYPTAIGFVVILLVVDVFLLRRLSENPFEWSAPQNRSVLIEKIPFAMITLALAAVAFSAHANSSGIWAAEFQNQPLSFLSRMAQAFYVWAYYLWKPWWPMDLSPTYMRLVSFEPTEWIFLFSGALVIGGTIWLFLQRKRWPLLFALWICHLALLVPFLGFTERPHYANDRYSYIPGLLWSALVSGALVKIWSQSKFKMAVLSGCLVVIAIFSALSFQQSQIWRNSDALFQAIIAKLGDDPRRANFYYRLGNSHAERNEMTQAMANYAEALKIHPAFPEVRNNLAAIYLGQGKIDDAVAQYDLILKSNPKNGLAHYNLANVLGQQGKTEEAITHYRAAVESDPKNADAHNNLGIALFKAGKPDEALEHVMTAVRLAPDSPQAQFTFGTALMQQQKFSEAIEHLSAAVRLKPDFAEAHSNLGNALAMLNRLPDALPHFAKAAELKPKSVQSYLPLGMALAQLGDKQAAAKNFRQAIALAEAAGQKELAAQIRTQANALEAAR